MKLKTRIFTVLILAVFCALASPVFAGTVITTNLPPGTSIVNIDARADGSANYSGDSDQSYWYQPTPTAPSVLLAPGTYRFRVIDPADAAALYPSLTAAQLNQIYTAWTYNSPWSEDYLAFNSTAIANSNEFQLFDGAITPGYPPSQTFGSATDAYNGTIADGYYNKIRPAPPGRAGTAADFQTQYTFNAPTNVLFVIPDYYLPDNTGGVSVVVTPVPEPSSLILAALSGAAMLIAGSTRRFAGDGRHRFAVHPS
jgi:hypothetical protein